MDYTLTEYPNKMQKVTDLDIKEDYCLYVHDNKVLDLVMDTDLN